MLRLDWLVRAAATGMQRWPAAASIAGILAAALFYVAVCLPQLGRPLIYDEVDFAKAAASLQQGSFAYDRGFIRDYPWNSDAGQRYQRALFHPPGYLLALAWWRSAGDGSVAWLRLFGVATGLVTLVATAVLAGRLGGPGAAVVAAWLWATAPLAIQGSLLLDIDGTVLPPAATLLAWVLAWVLARPDATPRSGRQPGRLDLRSARLIPQRTPAEGWPARLRMPSEVWFALAFAVALWGKLTTPPLLAAVLLVWLAWRRRWQRAGGVALALSAGAALFGVTWLAVASLWGVPASEPFLNLLYEAQDTFRAVGWGTTAASVTRWGHALAVLMVSAIRTAQWLHPLWLGLLCLAPAAIGRQHPARPWMWLVFAALAIYLSKLPGGFPKYITGVFPLLAAVTACALCSWLAAAKTPARTVVPGRARAPGLARGATDVNSRGNAPRANSATIGIALRRVHPMGWAAAAIVSAGIITTARGGDALIHLADLNLLAFWLALGASTLAAAAVAGAPRMAALAACLLLGANLATAGTQALRPTSTSYFYGTGGQQAAGEWLRQRLPSGALIIADRELAYYAPGLVFIDSELAVEPEMLAEAVHLAGAGSASAAVIGLASKYRWFWERVPEGLGAEPVRGAGQGEPIQFGEYRLWLVVAPGVRGGASAP